MWVGRDPVSAHLVQRHRERCLVIPQHDRCFGHVPTYEVVVWVLRQSVNIDVSRQQLYSLRTEETRAQMSYCSVTQKMTLHMTPNTVFTIPHSATASMLGFRRPVASEPEAVTSSPVIAIDSHPSDSSYPFHVEADDVVNMTQGFDTLYVYTDIVESRIVGDTLAPLLRALPISGRHGDRVSDRFTNVHYVPLF